MAMASGFSVVPGPGWRTYQVEFAGEVVDGEGLDEVFVGAGLEGGVDVPRGVFGADHDDRQIRVVALGSQGPNEVQTVDLWHVVVAQHDIETCFCVEDFLGGCGVWGGVHLGEAELAEHAAHGVAGGSGVVDDQRFHSSIIGSRSAEPEGGDA